MYQFSSSTAEINTDKVSTTYAFDEKSTTSTLEGLQTVESFLQSFESQINDLKLHEGNMNLVYKLCAGMVEQTSSFAAKLIADDNGFDVYESLKTASNYVCQRMAQSNSKYKRDKAYEINPQYIAPETLALGTRTVLASVEGTPTKYPHTIQNERKHFRISTTLKKLFERKDILDKYIDFNIEKQGEDSHICEPGTYKGFCCTETFKVNELFRNNPNSIQIHIAYDDFEIANPLHSMVYFTLGNMPPKYLSRLENIFLLHMSFTDDAKTKQTDFNDIWAPIVEDIHYLETVGINVSDNLNIKGTVVLTSFDNLGANTSLGFAEGFSASHFCRLCEESKMECQTLTTPFSRKNRTKANYMDNIHNIEQLLPSEFDYDKSKGIKRYCVLNDLQYYHILDNPILDIMHDINEGAFVFLLT